MILKPKKIPIPLYPKRVWQEAIDARNEMKDMFGIPTKEKIMTETPGQTGTNVSATAAETTVTTEGTSGTGVQNPVYLDEETGNITIAWGNTTVTHTAQEWLELDT